MSLPFFTQTCKISNTRKDWIGDEDFEWKGSRDQKHSSPYAIQLYKTKNLIWCNQKSNWRIQLEKPRHDEDMKILIPSSFSLLDIFIKVVNVNKCAGKGFPPSPLKAGLRASHPFTRRENKLYSLLQTYHCWSVTWKNIYIWWCCDILCHKKVKIYHEYWNSTDFSDWLGHQFTNFKKIKFWF